MIDKTGGGITCYLATLLGDVATQPLQNGYGGLDCVFENPSVGVDSYVPLQSRVYGEAEPQKN